MSIEPLIIAVAFILGLGSYLIHLPPLIGFLIAGFILHAMGYESSSVIEQLANLGVTLLLFTIGLKLKLSDLAKREIWGNATIHMLVTVIIYSLILYGLKTLQVPLITDLQTQGIVLVAFALSFSSTVFAVKILEDKGQMQAIYGRIAIGVLIMQDIFAVIFMTITSGKEPSLFALSLIFLPLLRPLLYKALEKCGHGELLALFGFFVALVLGAGLFSLLGLKADLGALIMGILLAPHAKSSELAKTLFYFKEIFLVLFFLSIGLSALPDWNSLLIAGLFLLLLPLKSIFYFYLYSRSNFRSRTSAFTALSLSNYSEFGLIVIALGVSSGMLDQQWLAVVAIALSMSFIFASPLNQQSIAIYKKFHDFFERQESEKLHNDDQLIHIGDAQVIIFGMGRIGSGAYDQMTQHFPDKIIGIDNNRDHVEQQLALGHHVIRGDATDSDFWQKVRHNHGIILVLLAMPSHNGNLYAAQQLFSQGYEGKIAAIATFPDQEKELKALGVHEVYNFYLEAGKGFADHLCEKQILNK